MSEYGFTKRDWALFREKIAEWQEAYMDKLNKEYIELLSGKGSPSEKFWALEERIRNDKKDTGVQLRMSRSNCISNIISLLNEGAITMADLDEFSDELKETIRFILSYE
ncbi:MAG: multidrug transporter [Blautia sp.]|nr:multidrug transporter [Blautia sp.]